MEVLGMSDLSNRKGYFEITRDLIKENPEQILQALKDVLVVHINDNFIDGKLEYFGYSKHFDAIELNVPAPKYKALITNSGKNVSVIWQKLDSYSKDEVKNMLDKIEVKINDINIEKLCSEIVSKIKLSSSNI
jgi:hypothetical protein